MTRIAWILSFSLAACLAASSLAAQQKFPLREIEIVGSKIYPADRVIALTGLKVGEPVAEADFQNALGKLNDAGVYDDLRYEFGPKDGGYRLVITVDEVDLTYPLRLDGFDMPREELLALLESKVPLFSETVPATGTMVDRIGDALQKHWKASGHDEDVMGRLAPIDAERLAMVFQPERRLDSIAFVKFEGSQIIDPLDLQRMFNPIAMGEPYTETRIRELLLANVRPLFEDSGRMAVKFCPCTTEPDDDTNGLNVTVQVEDGPAYVYSRIERPDVPGFEKSQIEKIIDFKPDQTVHMGDVRIAQGKLDEEMRKKGFLKAETTVDITINDEDRKVALEFDATPGKQYFFDRVEIRGLDILAEPAVRKRWGMKPGEPFNPTYPRYFLDRIEAEQMFDGLSDTRAETKIDEVSNKVHVILTFFGGGKREGVLDPLRDAPDRNPNDPFP